MWLFNFQIFVVLLIASCLHSLNAATCEEIETSYVKLDLAKQSINRAKSLYPKCTDETYESNCTAKDRALAYLNAALDLISEANITCHACPETKIIKDQIRPLDCSEVQTKVSNSSGVYKIWPRIDGVNSNKSIEVYCDMETDGGGWTVIQRRGNFAHRTDFYRDWDTYKKGFGDIRQEFWLGNEKIFILTNQGVYSVRFDLVDNKGEYRYALYNTFSIGNENSDYVLSIRNYSGNATDSMTHNHGSGFSTKDRPNDRRTDGFRCAKLYESAFWFDSGCGFANLNGIYQPGVASDKSIWWFNWKKNYDCLYSVEIKIRRLNTSNF